MTNPTPHALRDAVAFSQVPATVKVDGVDLPVIAAVYLPPRRGEFAGHVVAYTTDEKIAHGYATGLLVHDDEQQRSRLVEGAYDLTMTQALADVVRRLEA